jgi:hypothetical protein
VNDPPDSGRTGKKHFAFDNGAVITAAAAMVAARNSKTLKR